MYALVGDGSEFSTTEAANLLNVTKTTIQAWALSGLLRARWTVGGHTRVEPASIDDLKPLLQIPPGRTRDEAFAKLRAANLALRGGNEKADPAE